MTRAGFAPTHRMILYGETPADSAFEVQLDAPGFYPGNAPTEGEYLPADSEEQRASRFRLDPAAGVWFDWGWNPEALPGGPHGKPVRVVDRVEPIQPDARHGHGMEKMTAAEGRRVVDGIMSRVKGHKS